MEKELFKSELEGTNYAEANLDLSMEEVEGQDLPTAATDSAEAADGSSVTLYCCSCCCCC